LKLDRTRSPLKRVIYKTGLKGLFLFVLLAAAGIQAQTDLQNQQDPKLLYDQMLSSPSKYDYKGVLTYEQGGQLQSFEVGSVVSQGLIEQKLELLNGPKTSHHFSFDSSCEKKPSLKSSELSEYYNCSVRVAGYEGTEIVLLSHDKYRNGYQYVVDNVSKLMLRSMTLTPDRRMTERVQFAQLSYEAYMASDDEPGKEENLASVSADTNSQNEVTPTLEKIADKPHKIGCDQLSIENSWIAGWLPAGFVILDSKLEGERAVLVYGDGISTFSVFIDTVIESFLSPSNAQRGATTVYINYLSDHSSTYLVSIIGEIPLATAERVLSSLRRKY